MKRHDILSATALVAAATALLGCDRATYEVTGTGTATITYRDGDKKTVKDAPLPWTMKVMGSKLELSAKGTGKLECSIKREGKGIIGEVGTGACTTSATE